MIYFDYEAKVKNIFEKPKLKPIKAFNLIFNIKSHCINRKKYNKYGIFKKFQYN